MSQGVVAKSPDLATAATTGAEAASVAATAASTTTTSVVATTAAETAATVGFWASLHYWQKFTTMNPSILSAIYLYPLTFIEAVIEAFQVWTGLPWWQVICFYAFTARALGLPFLIRQVTYATKMEKLRPHLNALRERHMAKMSAAMGTLPSLLNSFINIGTKLNSYTKKYKNNGVTLHSTPINVLFILGSKFVDALIHSLI